MSFAAILIVGSQDDGGAIPRQLATHLPNCEVIAALDVEEGLAIARRRPLNCVIVDARMPRGAIDVCRRLTADPRAADVPLVFITARDGSPALRTEAIHAGASDLVSWPTDDVELLARVKMALRIKAAEDRLRESGRSPIQGPSAEYQHHLRGLASQLCIAEARERRRIAAGLHDRVGQNLAAVMMTLQLMGRPDASSAERPLLAESLDLVEEISRATRSLTSELCPLMLYELGLRPAVEWLAEDVLTTRGVAFTIQDDGGGDLLGDDMGAFLFHAARELLVNVTKHAGARNVEIALQRADDGIRLGVRDDGGGFDASKIAPHGRGNDGFGLFSIRERVRGLGGALDVSSEPGRGSRIALTVPIDWAADGPRAGSA